MSINTDSLTYEINNKKILDDISIEVNSGEVITVLGPNGSGKSTLINLLSGYIDPTRGNIYFDKVNIRNISIENKAFIRSVMSQSQPIVFDFSVKEIIEMGWLQKGFIKFSESFNKIFEEVIKEASIEDLVNEKFNVLSGGEQKRVHFARTLLQSWRPSDSTDPNYLLLDEPTANLDIKHEQRLMNVVRKKAAQGIGVLIVLHDINLAAKYSDKVILLKEGKLKGYGNVREILNENLLSNIYELPITISHSPFQVAY